MLDTDWYAGDRATPPERIEIFSKEQRIITISLASMVTVGETISPVGMGLTLTRWGKPAFSYGTALDGVYAYDAGSKAVSQKINASLLPLDTPIAFQVAFNVTMVNAALDRRSVVRVILVRV